MAIQQVLAEVDLAVLTPPVACQYPEDFRVFFAGALVEGGHHAARAGLGDREFDLPYPNLPPRVFFSEFNPDSDASRCFGLLAKKMLTSKLYKIPEKDTHFFWKHLNGNHVEQRLLLSQRRTTE